MAPQTLVENSVKYAVSSRRESGSISVRAHAADGRIRVSVEDDGPGFDPASRPGQTSITLDVPAESAIRNPQSAW